MLDRGNGRFLIQGEIGSQAFPGGAVLVDGTASLVLCRDEDRLWVSLEQYVYFDGYPGGTGIQCRTLSWLLLNGTRSRHRPSLTNRTHSTFGINARPTASRSISPRSTRSRAGAGSRITSFSSP